MEIRMETTKGLGREAEVWVDGRLLVVCDGVSQPARCCPPGVLRQVRFTYMTAEGFAWDQAVRGNPGRKKLLEHVRGWRYVGFGQVVQVMPVTVDFGLLTMEDANWSTNEELVGEFVKITIDRLEVGPAHEDDGPG
jgi:hypothetical protein